MTSKARILFVDDEKRVLSSMRGLFRRDYELFLTSEGADAIRIANENEIDVIVADQRMPGMTGIEVLAKIKEQSPRTVRILLTGYADPTAVEGSINLGEVFRFLSKPCAPKLLRETLTLAIAAARTSPAADSAVRQKSSDAQVEQPANAMPTAAGEMTTRPAVEPLPATQAVRESQPPVPAGNVPQPATTSASPAAEDEQDADATATELPVLQPAQLFPDNPGDAAPQIGDSEDTQSDLRICDESAMEATGEHAPSHWGTVTNVVMTEDVSEETTGSFPVNSLYAGARDVGVVIFTVNSEFAATAIRAVSTERNTIIATTLIKVAEAIERESAGVLVTDFTTNSATLQKIIGTLKTNMPELVTIVVSSGRDTTDMINLINYGQVFRYVFKPIEPEQLRNDVNAAVIRHLHLRNNPASAVRHQVAATPDSGGASETLNQFLGRVRRIRQARVDPTDTTP